MHQCLFKTSSEGLYLNFLFALHEFLLCEKRLMMMMMMMHAEHVQTHSVTYSISQLMFDPGLDCELQTVRRKNTIILGINKNLHLAL